ncbi:MAG: pseudouridine synthase [Eubacteriales bacterium]|nr:pseudouridine synthase [Eubacteriales bacterium]
MQILYEDNHLLVVEKPINMPVQEDATHDEDVLSWCKRYIKQKYGKAGEVYLGLVHRLDRPVGGVMVFARTSKAAARLTEQFRSHKAKKRYVAVVNGESKSSDTLEDWLYKDENTHSSSVVPQGSEGAKEARLSYRTLARSDSHSLLDVELFTGRSHQIRVQLSHSGYPIVGDQRYNPCAKGGTQIRLWAYALTIMHPTLNEPMTFYSLPNWDEFETQIKYLPAFPVCFAVYEDDDILVVDKNKGVEVTEELLCQLSTFTSPLYPVHRLDANTEGLVVFAKNERTKDALDKAFFEHQTDKIYHAIVLGTPSRDEARLVDYARKEGDGMILCGKDDSGAVRMELKYRVVDTNGDLSKLEVTLLTGRTHQIRVQLSAMGNPVLGDDRYGSYAKNKAHKCRTQALLAKRLTVLGKTFFSQKELTL